MLFYLPLVLGVMFPVHVTFVVWTHRWVAPIYVVNVVAAMLLYVYTYAYLMPHIL